MHSRTVCSILTAPWLPEIYVDSLRSVGSKSIWKFAQLRIKFRFACCSVVINTTRCGAVRILASCFLAASFGLCSTVVFAIACLFFFLHNQKGDYYPYSYGLQARMPHRTTNDEILRGPPIMRLPIKACFNPKFRPK